jgi:multiple sugar transport system permease protein
MLSHKKDNLKAWLYLLVPMILLSVFTFYPIIKTALVSLNPDFNEVTQEFNGKWGFGAFSTIFGYSGFKTVFWNTIIIVFVSVPLSLVVALAIAIALNSIKPLQKIFQTIFFTPYVTNTIAVGMVFSVIFNFDSGLINSLLGDKIDWIRSVSSGNKLNNMIVLQIYLLWNNLAFKVLVLLGGLQNIGKQYYDAAKVDGASNFKIQTRITIPLLSPMIIYILITSFIGAFKTYDAIVGLFGSNYSSTAQMQTLVGFIYWRLSVGDGGYSQAAAASIVLLGIIMVFTGLNFIVSKRMVHI